MSKKILIIVAHPDDEILGVGGTILKHLYNKDKVSVLILSDGETSRDSSADITKRSQQAKKAVQFLGVQNLFLEKFPDNKFDSLPLLNIIKIIEKYLNKIKPSIIYTHHAHDLNIDHQITFQAVLTACRPQPNFFVKKILCFETLSSTEWQIKNPAKSFCPTEYNNIDDFIDKKITALKIYQHELRKYPHPRSVEGIKILAQYRGIQVGCKYAEAFQLIRKLND